MRRLKKTELRKETQILILKLQTLNTELDIQIKSYQANGKLLQIMISWVVKLHDL